MTDIRIRDKLNYFDEMDLRPLLLMSETERFAARKELLMNFNLLSLLDFTISLSTGTLKHYAFLGILFAERQWFTNQIFCYVGDYNKDITQSYIL